MRKTIRYVSGLLTVVCAVVLCGISYWSYKLPTSYQVEQGCELTLSHLTTAPVHSKGMVSRVQATQSTAGESYQSVVKWCGIFPIKKVSVSVVERPTVVLGGIPFGIKLYTDGVLIVSLSDVDTVTGAVSPAKHAGLKVGDSIVSINGKEVFTNQEVATLVEESAGKPMSFTIRRDGIVSQVTFRAKKSVSEKRYKAGIWVRDSSAGIGTVTFYDPRYNILAGLGHAVCDVDTEELIPISSGEIVPARIYGVTKSEEGVPGELRGGFETGSFGDLLINCPAGVYAQMTKCGLAGEPLEIMLKQEVKVGPAKIYTTIYGTKPQWYDVEIKQVKYNDASATRNMIVEITDQALIEKTGGIVQGMSGSPIIQNGKLIGAVTHVLVDDPTKGYGIFAENMLETAQSVAECNKLKDAS